MLKLILGFEDKFKPVSLVICLYSENTTYTELAKSEYMSVLNVACIYDYIY